MKDFRTSATLFTVVLQRLQAAPQLVAMVLCKRAECLLHMVSVRLTMSVGIIFCDFFQFYEVNDLLLAVECTPSRRKYTVDLYRDCIFFSLAYLLPYLLINRLSDRLTDFIYIYSLSKSFF